MTTRSITETVWAYRTECATVFNAFYSARTQNDELSMDQLAARWQELHQMIEIRRAEDTKFDEVWQLLERITEDTPRSIAWMQSKLEFWLQS